MVHLPAVPPLDRNGRPGRGPPASGGRGRSGGWWPFPAAPPLDRNGRLVLLGKAFRAFGFGLNSVVLGLYLVELGLDAAAVGAVLSAGLGGAALARLLIRVFGDPPGG